MDPSWKVIESYFKAGHLQRLVRHQIESYNDFITRQIEATIEMFNPVVVHSDQFFNKEAKQYSLEIMVTFVNVRISRPQIHENNGATKLMFPQEARMRNFTYSACVTADMNIQYVVRTGPNLESTQHYHNTIPQVHLGKIPVMLKSCLCVLTHYAHLDHTVTGECKFDPGGYFIINGSEKTVLGQERTAENQVYCFQSGNSTKAVYQVELKSVPDHKRISPKQVTMYLVKTVGSQTIVVNIPRIRKAIPLFVLFRAMGVESDLAICRKITLVDDEELFEELEGSIADAGDCLTQDAAIDHIVGQAMYTSLKVDKATSALRKREFTTDVLENDIFPHCRDKDQRIALLGYMAGKLLRCSTGRMKCDDRDSYVNKRVDLTGTLLNNLYRNYFNKMVKDMQKQFIREMNTGSWRSTDDYAAIANSTNIYKIIKTNTIENGLKRALSTGDFGIKQVNSNKVGVAQVLNRLTYPASLSHLRRINTPIDKSGKLVAPRKLHNTTWGYMCPAETPEGPSIGVVKNLSYMAHVTIQCDTDSLYDFAEPFVIPHAELDESTILETKVFINGAWIGNSLRPQELYLHLKQKKYGSHINIYTSIVFDYQGNEIRVCNDAGRLVRPLFKLRAGRRVDFEAAEWDELLVDTADRESVIEYIDPAEQNAALIAMTAREVPAGSTHLELHPSTIFGVLASYIPFPDHNQSPRNTYQCAMGKQAIGVYVTNYQMRMDKTAYVLTYPHRPLVDTRLMTMLKLNDLPSGMPVIVAILTHTGYNQEDSVMISQGAIDRGLFQATIYHTEKDEDKKMHGDVEVRCKPDPLRTKGIKFGNYDKLGSDGLMPENTLIENLDIIMGKVVPIKDARNDPTKVVKFEDMSRCHRTDEAAYIDKNYTDVNGDGYSFWKCRIRALRVPNIGDKFSSRHGQKGTAGNIIPEKDLPFTAAGLKPDIIINPHAIPSRMTIAQLKETLLGKVLLELGMYGDGTAFTGLSVADISKELLNLGYEANGNELMYNGLTGEQLQANVFIGPCFYQRLKHMVLDKQHSRSQGPMVSLTRQPAEGRARDGGLRFGEMERDCMISHGAAAFTKGRVYDASDKFHVHACNKCGMIAAYNDKSSIHKCSNCDNRADFTRVNLPYSCKLLFQELMTMNIAPRLIT
jgi:DNA-directed RNA polymerase II subunit RPB2